MISLDKDLQKSKESLDDFGKITRRILSYLPNILSDYQEKSGYRISSSEIAGTKKYIRPVKRSLLDGIFIWILRPMQIKSPILIT
jgi:hypothetical protein